jgi:hypothetical protein
MSAVEVYKHIMAGRYDAASKEATWLTNVADDSGNLQRAYNQLQRVNRTALTTKELGHVTELETKLTSLGAVDQASQSNNRPVRNTARHSRRGPPAPSGAFTFSLNGTDRTVAMRHLTDDVDASFTAHGSMPKGSISIDSDTISTRPSIDI